MLLTDNRYQLLKYICASLIATYRFVILFVNIITYVIWPGNFIRPSLNNRQFYLFLTHNSSYSMFICNWTSSFYTLPYTQAYTTSLNWNVFVKNAILSFHFYILGYTTPVSVASGNSTNSSSPLSNRTSSPPESNTTGSTQQTQNSAGSGQNPMAALISVADNLPPGSPRSTGGSPPTNVVPRSASRGSQHSPNSTGKHRLSRNPGFR